MKASLLFSILTAGVLFFTSSCKEKPAPAPVLPGVVAVPAAEADYAEYMPSISNIMAFDSVDLVARVEGFLLKRNFKDGELVKKGQLLFQIEPEKYEAAVAAAEADLLKARADQKNSTSDYERQKTLLAKDAVSRRKYDEAESQKMQSDAAVLAAIVENCTDFKGSRRLADLIIKGIKTACERIFFPVLETELHGN